jgi:alkylated DNA repair protein (DNA oxidative demethylase)
VGEEQMLVDHIDASSLTPFRFLGWTGKRLPSSFGWNYDFKAGRLVEAPPISDEFRPFRDRVAGLPGEPVSL